MELIRFVFPSILMVMVWQWVKTTPLNKPLSLYDLYEIVNSPSYVDECVFGEPLKDDCETCSKLGKSPEAYYLCCGKGDLRGVRTWCRKFLAYTLPNSSAIIHQDRR